jgi:photosystem II stability/assembly factor-like uncharacterized protein
MVDSGCHAEPVSETVLGIGTRKGLWLARSADRRDWQLTGPHFLMSEVLSILFDTRGGRTRTLVGFRSSHWGPALQHSDDLGATWVEHPEGSIRFPAATGTALQATWQLVADPHEDSVVWAGSEPHALWRSEDAGETFTLNAALWEHPHRSEWGEGYGGGAIHTVLPSPADPASMLVAMSAGGVYNTRDGGRSWSPGNTGIHAYFLPHDEWPEFGQCVHKVARDAVDHARLYAQNHRGVYRSDDQGLTWQSIEAGLPTNFGMTVLTHPRAADTVWLVPIASDGERIPPGARLQVQRSRDAGATWETLTEGLPAPCYTNVLRDAACTDTHEEPGLYIGTRNGEVYTSTDEGESFVRLAAQLPDVLCVRAVTLP